MLIIVGMEESEYNEQQKWALKEALRILSEFYDNSIITVKGNRKPIEVITNADKDLLSPMLDHAYQVLFPTEEENWDDWQSWELEDGD